MKILFLINGVGGGGKERRFLQLVGALKENPDMEILIVSVSSRSDYDLNFLFGKARVIDLGLQKRYTLFVALFRIIRDFRPHVIHSWCAIPIVLAVLAVGKIFFSYKYIARMYPEHKKEYFKMFTKYNIIYLIILCVAAFLIKMVL